MNRFLAAAIAAVGIGVGIGAANADVITFTSGQGVGGGTTGAQTFSNGGTVTSTYQPIAGTVITWGNTSTYNAAADHTSGTANTANFFTYPTSGNNGTIELDFSNGVSIPSFYYDNFHDTGAVIVHAYTGVGGTTELTPVGGVSLTIPTHPDVAPTFAQATQLSAYSNITKVTFQNSNGMADAVNIDDITVNVPEPASMSLLGLGALGLLGRRRKA